MVERIANVDNYVADLRKVVNVRIPPHPSLTGQVNTYDDDVEMVSSTAKSYFESFCEVLHE